MQMTKLIVVVLVVAVTYILPGSFGENCYVGQDTKTDWVQYWNPCSQRCNMVALGGINIEESMTPGMLFPVISSGQSAGFGDIVSGSFDCPEDLEPPSITCPATIAVFTDIQSSSASATWSALTVTDNSIHEPTVSCSSKSGSRFQLGLSEVKCTASDQSGNNASCKFRVVVLDAEAPNITCPANVTAPTVVGGNTAFVNWSSLQVEDNSGLHPAVSCDYTSGSSFSLGTTLIKCVATDAAGNEAICHFSVQITDVEAPSVTCPANLIAPAIVGGNTTEVTWDLLQVYDNSGQSPAVSCDYTSGSTFPLGVTIINCVAVDAAGNDATCNFKVKIVSDEEPPAIACVSNVKAHGTSVTNSVVTWSLPVAIDNLGPTSVDCQPSSGSTFNSGISTVVCTATDWASLSTTCNIQVDVTVDCQSILAGGQNVSGVYTVQPQGFSTRFDVFCDMSTDGGGWTVFQKRYDGSEDFYRTWNEYRDGFGNLSGEFWLGNEILHNMTLIGDWELRVDLGDYSDPMVTAYAHYDSFAIGDSNTYALAIGTYSENSTAGDSLGWHNTRKFFTHDSDTMDSAYECAKDCHGAWWYTSCRHSNLNGPWGGPKRSNVDVPSYGSKCPELMNWFHFKGDWDSVKTTEMKLRRKV